MNKYPDELTCDMAETYGVFDIRRLPVRLAATLALGLRADSRVSMKINESAVDDKTLLLASVADSLRWLVWAKTEDGHKGRNQPESLLAKIIGDDDEPTGYRTPEEFEAAYKEIIGEL